MICRAGAMSVILLTAACTTTTPPPSLTVMTYNIRLNLASDGPNAWPHRKEAVAELMKQADLIGVQEALPEQLADLDRMLPELDRFGVGRNAERSGEHTAIFYRRDRIEVLAHDTFWLSPTPQVAGSKGWDAAYERIATWGRLRDRSSGRTFYMFNSHFDHIGKEARRESARLLLSRIPDGLPVIVTGDFNDVATSEPLAILTRELRDTIDLTQSAPRGPDSTWNAFKAFEPGRRIDFILVRGPIDVISHSTLASTVGEGRFPSDHLPVVAEVRIGRD